MTVPSLARWACCLFLGLVALAPAARAEAPARHVSFAVVIGNNRSLGARRPDLHYADDDAAKYFEILSTLAGDRVFLLSDFDDDTARLFPDTRAHAAPPTRAELQRVGREIASGVRAAAAAGAETEVYFVFAGHGDVDEGTGFIELQDGRVTSADLEAWLRAIPFTRAHVILDSCNSFFMLGARRPGGRYFATAEDAARSLAARLPNVGVFLSTSAEGEVFEWSEIQSGIFSHVVRSGLLGAADADGDGAVSYRELAAFVATATADVANPNMRPHVFARGPGGHDGLPIVSLRARSGARTLELSQAAPQRIRLRDREGVPVLDAHTESGQPLAVTLPDAWGSGIVVERVAPGGASAALETYTVPDTRADLTLASLEPLQARGAARGPAEIFQKLFARPFGPRALASYQAQAVQTQPVFGVSRQDAERMDLLLGQIEEAEHGNRLLAGTVMLGAGAVVGLAGLSSIEFDRSLPGVSRTAANIWGGVFLGIGALYLAYGTSSLARPWAGERLASDYRTALGKDGDYAHAFALADERIRAIAAEQIERRRRQRIASGAVFVVGALSLVGSELSGASANDRFVARSVGGTIMVFGASGVLGSFLLRSPIERLANVWKRDPGFLNLEPTLAPTRGGAMLGLTGTF